MDNDFKRPLGPVATNNATTSNASVPTEIEPSPGLPQAPEKPKRSKVTLILTILLLLVLLGVGALGYVWMMQKQDLDSANTRVNQLQAQVTKLQSDAKLGDASAKALAEAAKMPNYGVLNDEYKKMLAATVSGKTPETEKAAIEKALKDHYKVTSIPSGAATLAVYQVVKPNTAPSGEMRALVYWPAAASKPAELVDMIKPVDGNWKYNETP